MPLHRPSAAHDTASPAGSRTFRRSLTGLGVAAVALLAAAPALAFGPQTYTTRAVTVDGFLGTVTVTVDPAATGTTVAVSGTERWLREVTVREEGGRLIVEQRDRPRNNRMDDRTDWLDVRLTVPTGAALTIDDHIGIGQIGDLAGPLTIENFVAGTITAGTVARLEADVTGSGDVTVAAADETDVDVAGSGDVEVGRVNGPLSVDVAGSGNVTTGDVAGPLSVDIAGSGNVTTGTTRGKVVVEIAGSGEVQVASVDGPVDLSVSGSGNVELDGGTADPFTVGVSGSGSVTMKGNARNQTINRSGSGTVRIVNAN